MSVTIQPLFEPVQLPNAVAPQFTAQAPTRIDKLTVVNSSTTTGHTVTIYWVPSGGAPGATNIIAVQRRLQPKEAWDVTQFIGHTLADGDSIQAFADAAAVVNMFGSGTVVS